MSEEVPQVAGPITLGRYDLFMEIARGGMAAVYLGRQRGAVGFSRTVAIKRLHPHFAHDPEFVAMFLDEARLAARIRHPNVASTLDVGTLAGELFLVMELVVGASLSALAREGAEPPSVHVAAAILLDVLHGLDAAHHARSESGEPLHIVHRDISPQNVLVGVDGSARLLDFGIAKAANRLNDSTDEGTLKGKLPYMAPELVRGVPANRATDLYATGVVLWELLTGKQLFVAEHQAAVLERLLYAKVPAPSTLRADGSTALDEVAAVAIARDPTQRYESAAAMALAVERAVRPASRSEVAAWVRKVGDTLVRRREAQIAVVERGHRGPDSVDNVMRELASSQNDVDATPESKPRATPSGSALGPASSVETVVTEPLGPVRSPLAAASAAGSNVATLVEGPAPRFSAPEPAIPVAIAYEPPPRSRRGRVALVLVAALLLAATAVGLVAFFAEPKRPLAALPPAPSTSAPPEPPSAPVPSATASIAAPLPAPSTSTSSHLAEAKPHKAAPAPTRRAAPDCSIGYQIDEHGNHRYLRECLPKSPPGAK